MPDELAEILAEILPIAFFSFGGLVVSVVILVLLAKRKHRNPWGWGLLGALFFLPALVILAFLPHVCRTCGQAFTREESQKLRKAQGKCSKCGEVSRDSGVPHTWIFGLASLVVLHTLTLLWLWMICAAGARELRKLQSEAAAINRNKAVITALVNDALEYSKKNPAINPILEMVGVKGAQPVQPGNDKARKK